MMRKPLFRRLAADTRGSALIETAIVTPVLLIMALGTFDVSQMVAHQHRLQTGAADAESIVLAVASGTATNTTAVRTALSNSLNLPPSKVAVSVVFRCNSQNTLSATNDCGSGQRVSTYVRVRFTDTYTPKWTDFGVGEPINYNVTRTIQVS